MTDKRRSSVYMDAHAIIDTLKADLFPSAPKLDGVPANKQPYFIDNFKAKKKHLEYCANIIKAARNGELDLLTSTLTLAEVWHLGIKPPSDEDKRVIESVLTSGKVFKLVPDSFFIGRNARDLMWVNGIELTGADAIHVASALEAKCDEFITTDSEIVAAAEKLKAKGLLVISADKTTSLPASYFSPIAEAAADAEAEAEAIKVMESQELLFPDELPTDGANPSEDYFDEDPAKVAAAAQTGFIEIVEETELEEE